MLHGFPILNKQIFCKFRFSENPRGSSIRMILEGSGIASNQGSEKLFLPPVVLLSCFLPSFLLSFLPSLLPSFWFSIFNCSTITYTSSSITPRLSIVARFFPLCSSTRNNLSSIDFELSYFSKRKFLEKGTATNTIGNLILRTRKDIHLFLYLSPLFRSPLLFTSIFCGR